MYNKAYNLYKFKTVKELSESFLVASYFELDFYLSANTCSFGKTSSLFLNVNLIIITVKIMLATISITISISACQNPQLIMSVLHSGRFILHGMLIAM